MTEIVFAMLFLNLHTRTLLSLFTERRMKIELKYRLLNTISLSLATIIMKVLSVLLVMLNVYIVSSSAHL